MNEKELFNLDDNLIRRALALEIDSVEPPAADRMWRAIEKGLAKKQAPVGRTFPGWFRYAGLAAAACLVIVLGSVGLFRAVQFASPAAEFDAALEFETVSETEALVEPDAKLETPADVTALETGEEEDEEARVPAAAQPEPEAVGEELMTAAGLESDSVLLPPWPEQLGSDYTFSEEIILPLTDGEPLQVALYSGQEHDLLFVRSATPGEDLQLFVERVGQQMQFPINNFLTEENNLFFSAGGYTGLANQSNGLNRAIMAPFGAVEKEQLISLAALIQ